MQSLYRSTIFVLALFSVSLSACGSNDGPALLANADASWDVAANTVGTAVGKAAPLVAERIQAMPAGTGLLLPKPTVVALDADLSGGPPSRDYSNRMVYSKQRQTAVYLGAGHNNHRRNDVWEYHLASNTWQQLFPSDGGSHKPLNALFYHVLGKQKQIAANGYNAKQEQILDAARLWWKDNARFENGRITTRYGGPLLPFHTWDAVVFDDSVGKLLWATGANWLPVDKAQAVISGEPIDSIRRQLEPNLSKMWTFTPSTQEYQQSLSAANAPGLRGMGSSMVYLPDQKKSLYYVAAPNVTPGDFGMYLYDARANRWQELKPNGGSTIRELAVEQSVAPLAEAQLAYSEKHQIILAVRKNDSYIYDIRANTWERLPTDDRIYGHDARSVLAYDTAADVFLLANPTNEFAPLVEFSPVDRRWNVLRVNGDSFVSKQKKYGFIGYYDPTFERLVLRRGRGGFWVYRR